MVSTLNGIDINIAQISFKSANRNVYTPSINGIGGNVSYSGKEGIRIILSGWCNSESDYDELIASIMAEGEHTLSIRTNWEYRLFSITLDTSFRRGLPDHRFDFGVSMVSEHPYQFSTTTTTVNETITTNPHTWTGITTSGTVSTPVNIKIAADNTPGSAVATIEQLERN